MKKFFALCLLAIAGCLPPPQSAAQACYRAAAFQKMGRSIGNNNNPVADYLEDTRCDQLARDEIERNQKEIARLEQKKVQEQLSLELKEYSKVVSFPINECVVAGATYEHSYREKEGNCGPIHTAVNTVPKDGIIHVSGKPGRNYHYEGCSVFLDWTSKNLGSDGAIYTRKTFGKMNWTQDGSSGNGVETVNISTSDGRYCTSTYELTATKI